LRLGMLQGVAGGAAVSLMQGVLGTMWISQCVKVGAAVVVAGGMMVGGAGLIAQTATVLGQARRGGDDAAKPRDGAGLAVQEVKRGSVVAHVTEKGILETSSNYDEYCEVEGQRAIVHLVPEGTQVKKGDVVCQLDSTQLRAQLAEQQFKIKLAEADFMNAKLTHEIVQKIKITFIHLLETGLDPEFLKTLEELKRDPKALADDKPTTGSVLLNAERRLELQMWTERLARNKNATRKLVDALPSDLMTATPADWKKFSAALEIYARETHAIGDEKSRLGPINKSTANQKIKEIETQLAQALVNEKSRKSVWEQERTKEAKLAKQIAACVLIAPHDGAVLHANGPTQPGRLDQLAVGVMVRKRQKLFRISDLSKPMQVNLRVHESNIGKVAFGMNANIWVEAFPDQVFAGRLTQVGRFARPAGFLKPNVQVYPAQVRITDGTKAFRSGMSAWVEIFVDHPDVLSVPLGAVIRYDNSDHLAVKRADGGIEWREVKLGLANETIVEVQAGITAGEQVVLDPVSLMTEQERKQKLGGGVAKPVPGGTRK
jgi:HlyD family secretion protein